MSDLKKIEATVFVYRHRITGIVSAHYIDTALNFEEAAEWEHVATLNPRLWIEFNYFVVEQRDELLAALKGLMHYFEDDEDSHNKSIFETCRNVISKTPAQSLQSVINETIEKVETILIGIDKTETETNDGWWETSAGANFGAEKLQTIRTLKVTND